MSDFPQPPTFREQLQADKATLEAMIENHHEHAKQLTSEAGDPLRLGIALASARGAHNAYIQTLEDSLQVVSSLLEYVS